MIKTVLASNSPRRREIFGKIAPDFTTVPSDADETLPDGIDPREAVKLLARRKAESVYGKLKDTMSEDDDLIVLGADTVVAYEGRIFGKPKDEADARRILSFLSGKTHSVFTGVCFVDRLGETVSAEESRVTFELLDEAGIGDYIAGGSPMDKAGAYGIQDGYPVKEYEGSYTNIVGLPAELTEEIYAARTAKLREGKKR